MNRISDSDKLEVSVIIPMYGVEKYIERCARSLMEQSLTTGVEFLFINDASNDKSVSVLEKVLLDYPSRKAASQIITMKQIRVFRRLEIPDWKEPEENMLFILMETIFLNRKCWKRCWQKQKEVMRTSFGVIIFWHIQTKRVLSVSRHSRTL